jgi:hypothetical protein
MRAVGYKRALPFDDPQSLLDVTVPEPEPQPHDLRVDVNAVAVNPVDWKVRQSTNRQDARHGQLCASGERRLSPVLPHGNSSSTVFRCWEVLLPLATSCWS